MDVFKIVVRESNEITLKGKNVGPCFRRYE